MISKKNEDAWRREEMSQGQISNYPQILKRVISTRGRNLEVL